MIYYLIIPIKSIDGMFYYKSNLFIKNGSLVEIKIKNSNEFGIIYKEVKNEEIAFNLEKIKIINQVYRENFLNEKQLNFLIFFGKYNIIKLGDVANLFFYKTFFTKKINKIFPEYKYNGNNINLTTEQFAIFEKFKYDNFNIFVLNGKTGSGKTVVYLKFIDKILINDIKSNILILIPEISLAEEMRIILEKKYKIKTAVWHSKKQESYKKDLFGKILNNELNILIGTRSALCLPFQNLKAIVIDEEHDPLYKQEEYPFFHAREMAIVLAKELNIPIILSSGTISLDTYYNIKIGKYIEYEMKNQFFHSEKKRISIHKSENELISKEMIDLIDEKIKNKKQILIFLNKRGYVNNISCSKCKDVLLCKNCNIKLTYHLKKGFICHYCRYTEEYFNKCKKCDGKLTSNGIGGIEMINEILLKKILNAKTLLLSSDLMLNENKIKDSIEKIHKKEVNIIIATQIISKGYHFSDLNDLIIIDNYYNDEDFRANERLFQLLLQVSGRVGRESDCGNVYIQTKNADNFAIKAILNNEIDEFYLKEIDNRKNGKVYPFYNLLYILISNKIEQYAFDEANFLSNYLRKNININVDISIFGPVKAEIFMLRNEFRYKILIKFLRNKNQVNIIFEIKNLINKYNQDYKSTKIFANLNPYSFF